VGLRVARENPDIAAPEDDEGESEEVDADRE
jgi:hypothetical protein